jgi:hypothetical protein
MARHGDHSIDGTDPSLLRGAAMGAVGGLAGSLAMTLALRLLDRLGYPRAPHHPQHSVYRGLPASARRDPLTLAQDATVELADRAARLLLRRRLSRREKEVAGPLVHYLFGAGAGAIYGALVERHPDSRGGLRFGGVVWVLADFLGLPLLGVAPPQWETPVAVHARGVASHVPYGLVTERVRRALRAGR